MLTTASMCAGKNGSRSASLRGPMSALLGDQRGIELVEMLVLIAFVALGSIAAMKGLRDALRRAAEVQGSLIESLQPGSAPHAPGGPNSAGPELGRPIGPTGPGVLEPGSIDPRRLPPDFEAKVTAPNGVGYRVRIKSSQTTALEPNGQSMVTLEVTRTRQATAKKSESGRWVGGVELFLGDGLSYRVKLPEAEYQRILRGEASFPNPGDISTLPDGSSVLLREEDLSASELSGAYRIFRMASRQTNSQGSAVGLEVRGDRVRVLAGPTESVTDLTVFGVSSDDKGAPSDQKSSPVEFTASFERTKSLRYYDLDYADLSRSQGQAAFEEFMRSGRVPQPDHVGVLQAGSVRKLDYDDASNAKLSLSAGPFELTSRLLSSSASARNTDVVRPDGSHEMTWIVNERGVGVFETKTLAPDGRETRSQSGLLLDAVDPSYGRTLGDAYGAHTEDKSYDLQLEMSQAEYTALRSRAIDWLDGQSLYNDKQIAELRTGRDPGPTGNPVVDALVSHTDADDFLADVRLRNDGPSNVTEGLLRLYAATSERGPLPGRMQFYDEHR